MVAIVMVCVALCVLLFSFGLFQYLRKSALREEHLEYKLDTERQLDEVKLAVAVERKSVSMLEGDKKLLNEQVEYLRTQNQRALEQMSVLKTEASHANALRDSALDESQQQRQRVNLLTEQIESLRQKVSSLETTNKVLQHANEAQPEAVKRMLADASTQFSTLATELLESKSKAFDEHAIGNIGSALNPLRENIAAFEKFVKETAAEETKDIFTLKGCVDLLTKGTENITTSTAALEKAFRGNSKYRGNYGELVLDRVLECAGLVEGREYEKQATLKTEAGTNSYPDVIVNFTDNRKVVVDSKVSLSSWESYNVAETEEDRSAAAAAHVKALMKHVDELADKDYSSLIGAKSPSFVFMFVPVETAYFLALEHEPNLQVKAAAKRVIILVPSTLIVSLKMVGAFWLQERQATNALKIATEAGKLYDKFVGLTEDLEAIDQTFCKGQNLVKDAVSKLKTGPGSVMRKVDELVKLGATPKRQKRLKESLLEPDEKDNQTADVLQLPVASEPSEVEETV